MFHPTLRGARFDCYWVPMERLQDGPGAYILPERGLKDFLSRGTAGPSNKAYTNAAVRKGRFCLLPARHGNPSDPLKKNGGGQRETRQFFLANALLSILKQYLTQVDRITLYQPRRLRTASLASAGPAAGTSGTSALGAPTLSRLRSSASILAKTSLCSLRNERVFSRPWPMRSPS